MWSRSTSIAAAGRTWTAAVKGSLSNSGLISGAGPAILNQGTFGTLSNNGLISSPQYAIDNRSGTISSLVNNGTITAPSSSAVENESGAVISAMTIATVYLLGLAAAPFLPETHGSPLPR